MEMAKFEQAPAIMPTQTSQSKAPHRVRTAWILFGLSLLVRLFFLSISDNQDGDAFARIRLSREVVEQRTWNPTEIWLPIHFWILAIPRALGLHSQMWPRLLTALAGAGTVPFAYLLIRRLGTGASALSVGLLLMLNPLHIRYSVVTVSEGFSIFFITVGLWGLTAFVKEGKWPYLLIGALAFNLACGHRMEAWLFLPWIISIVLWSRFLLGIPLSMDGRRRVAIYAGAAGIFVLGWCSYSWINYGNPVEIATLNAERVGMDLQYQDSKGLYTLAFWPAVLIASLGPIAAGVGAMAVFRGAMRGPVRLLSLLFAFFLLVYYFENVRSGLITDARYGLLLVWLMILALGVTSSRVSWWNSPRTLGAASLVWLLVTWGIAQSSFGSVSSKMNSISPRPLVEYDLRQADKWLRSHPNQGAIVFGPGIGKYSPWMSLLDDWYDMRRVKVMKTKEKVTQLATVNPTGYLVTRTGSPLAREIEGNHVFARLSIGKAVSMGDFVIYKWSASRFPRSSTAVPVTR